MKMKFNKAEVGDRIASNLKKIRESYGCTQTEMSNKCQINDRMYNLWENGYVMPSTLGLLTLSESLGISMDDLVKKEL